MNRLTLIIPIYNGSQHIASTRDTLMKYHKTHPFHEIILVNDGSTDKTAEALKSVSTNVAPDKLPVKILSYNKNKGKGYAVKFAVEHAKETDIIGFTDVEIPYGLDSLKKVQRLLAQHEDIDTVIGERSQNTSQYSTYRLIATKIFRLFIPRRIRHIQDTQCGFKFFRYQTAKKVFTKVQTHRWIFDIEVLLILKSLGKRIKKIPVSIKPSCKGKGAVTFLGSGPQILWDRLKIFFYDVKGHYKS